MCVCKIALVFFLYMCLWTYFMCTYMLRWWYNVHTRVCVPLSAYIVPVFFHLYVLSKLSNRIHPCWGLIARLKSFRHYKYRTVYSHIFLPIYMHMSVTVSFISPLHIFFFLSFFLLFSLLFFFLSHFIFNSLLPHFYDVACPQQWVAKLATSK